MTIREVIYNCLMDSGLMSIEDAGEHSEIITNSIRKNIEDIPLQASFPLINSTDLHNIKQAIIEGVK